MSKVEEIGAAITSLAAQERAVVSLLPTILPELDGDAAWERIINDSRPRLALSNYIDEIKAGIAARTLELREMSDEEFRRHEGHPEGPRSFGGFTPTYRQRLSARPRPRTKRSPKIQPIRVFIWNGFAPTPEHGPCE